MRNFFKVLAGLFFVMFFAMSANAFNVLQDNQKYKQELSDMGFKQQSINKKEIQYYKGKSDYYGTSSNSAKSASTRKKGVRFKLDDANKQKLEAKEKELAQKEQEQAKTQAEQEKQPSQKMPEKGDNHNADAE